jgi:hypothetical protein
MKVYGGDAYDRLNRRVPHPFAVFAKGWAREKDTHVEAQQKANLLA